MSQHMPAIAMLLGVSSEFFWKCREALARAGAVAMEASLPDATSAVLRWHPQVLLLTEDVYAFDPPRFDALAEVVGAAVAIVGSEDEPVPLVERRVAKALTAARRIRRDQSERATVRPPTSISPTSGVREALPVTRRPHPLRLAGRGR